MDTQITAEERKRLAGQLGLHEQYLYQCLTGRREMKPTEAMRAELETGGALTRSMLCQRTYALIWPDLALPQGAPKRSATHHPHQRATDHPGAHAKAA